MVNDGDLSDAGRSALMEGRMNLSVSGDQLTVAPEGNVQEALPLKKQVADQYIRQFIRDAT